MDRKQLITSIVVAIAVLGLWWGFEHILEKAAPQLFTPPQQAESPATEPSATQPAQASTTQPTVASSVSTSTTLPTTGPAVASVAPPTVEPASRPAISAVGASGPAEPVMLGVATPTVTRNSQYAIGVALSPTGAAIDSVTLNRYGSDDKHPKIPYRYQQPYSSEPNSAALATRSITINGATVDLSQVTWKVATGGDSGHVTFELPLIDAAGKPVATLKKSFALPPASADPKTSQGYEIAVDLSVQNQTGAPMTVQAVYNGTTMPPREINRSDDRVVIVATSTNPSELSVAQHFLAEFKPNTAPIDLSKDAVWAGEASAYFDAIVLPMPNIPAGAQRPLYTIKAAALEPDNADKDVVLTFTTDTQTVAAGHSLAIDSSVFLGPKERDLLQATYYAAFPRNFDQSLVIHGSCSFLTFGWLVWALVDFLRFFHDWIFHDWGLSIILLVCIVRGILHPITKASQVNMMKMGKMAPEMERLKKKYGDDKDALNKAMMDVYKDQGLAPVLGCLPMFLQMPIWIALWGALQSTFALRQSPFLWGFTWIRDLATPDTVIGWPSHPITIPLISSMMGGPIAGLNILPVLMGVVFYLQQKYTPKPPAATPEQEQQQKMMQWMSLVFPLFLYNGPSGLNLYILTSTTIGIFENRIIRRHIKQKEEAEKAGRVFVETKPTRAKKNLPTTTKAEPKKSRLGRWMSDLQSRAEQIQKEAERKKRRET